jgi:hypothetical protein
MWGGRPKGGGGDAEGWEEVDGGPLAEALQCSVLEEDDAVCVGSGTAGVV